MAVRKLPALLWCTSLLAADVGQLRQLVDNNRIFELRRDLQQPGSDESETLFYRGIVACRFGHETEGVKLLRSFLAAKPETWAVRKAHEEIADALGRVGLYHEAAQAWTEALQLTPAEDPEREDHENTQALMASLGDAPPEKVEFGTDAPTKATRNKLGSWDVPVEVNGFTGQWIFDTGAGMSTVSASEAKRLGLTVRESKAWVGGSTDKKNPLRLAVAGDLQFGGVHVHNVVFLVLSDQALYIAPLHDQINGILGLPAIRALGTVDIAKSGLVQVHSPEASPAGEPNLFFDGDAPIVEVDHGGSRLQMFLDSGANDTSLYPSFRDALSREEIDRAKSRRAKMAGAGGAIQVNTETLPTLRFAIFGMSVDLKKIDILPDQPKDEKRFRDGVVGMDALWGGFLLDFDAMQLVIR